MLWQQLINGLTQGGTYALIAIGYTLIFGVLEIINLAHGEVFMVGAVAGYALVMLLGWGLLPALIGGMIGAALLGAVLEFTALRALRRKGVSNLAPLISTIGLGMVLQNVMIRVVGAEPLPFRVPLAGFVLRLGPLQVTATQLVVLGVSLVLMIALQWTLSRTGLGRAVRAVSENPETAALLGVNVSGIVLATVMLASALGGAAGVLVGVSFVSVSAVMGMSYGLKGLAVIILGGLGNVSGAVAGGLLIGVLEALTVAYGGAFAGYKDAVAFGFLFLVLVARPQGLLGQGAAVTRRS
ncbi:MAG: branched-chain amino acid ABC-type transport system, permease component [Symbiobacteriaceae bacterium]|jgi:branched-chain amino acid transport system permease protein|nr:branched-chain amino acid ABC-type transport system, permease component [Symbiobacteriaceae bacterium]